jgi:hypothetical protein
MGLRYNPFNGSFDFTRSPGSYLDGEVATYDDLPLDTAAAPLNSAWLVREASGLWFLTRKPAGIYVRSATGGTDRDADYTYAGTFPDVFSDANFVVYNDADSTKNVKFSAANVTTGTTRTLTVPDKNGTLATTDAADLTTGTLADARLSSNVPLKDASNTFTQNQTLDGTNNVAPNQTAASGASIMTRDLVDARTLPLGSAPRYVGFWSQFNGGNMTSTPAGGILTQGLNIRCNTNNTANLVAKYIQRDMLPVALGYPSATSLNWSHNLEFGALIHTATFATNGNIYIYFGGSSSFTSGQNTLRHVGFRISGADVHATHADGTTYAEAGSASVIQGGNGATHWLHIASNNGNVVWSVDGTQIATTSSGPTGTGGGLTGSFITSSETGAVAGFAYVDIWQLFCRRNP